MIPAMSNPRARSAVVLALLASACVDPPPTPLPAPAASAVRAAPRNDRVFQAGERPLFGERIDLPLPGSDAHPAWRLLSGAEGGAQELRPVVEDAQWAQRLLLTVESGRLLRWEQGGSHVLAEGVAPGIAVDATGRFVAFAKRRPELTVDTDLFLVPVGGGEPRALAAVAGSPQDRPRFTPDGVAVLFMSGEGGHAGLWRVELADGSRRRLATFAEAPLELRSATFEGDRIRATTARGERFEADWRAP